MTFSWYKIFNLNEFLAAGLVQQTYTVELDDRGQFDILVVKGAFVSMIFHGILLPIQFNSENPFEFEDHAVYIYPSGNVFLGIGIPDDET